MQANNTENSQSVKYLKMAIIFNDLNLSNFYVVNRLKCTIFMLLSTNTNTTFFTTLCETLL
jgi:hypothetical protein